MGYDKKLRERVFAHVDAVKTQEEVRKMFGLGVNTITQWKKLRAERGSLENRPLERKHKKVDPEKLRNYLEQNPESFDYEAGAEFGCSGEALRQARNKHRITRKKRE
jgi:transposase